MSLRPVADHLAAVLAQARVLPAEEVVLADTLGRRLATDVSARFAVPPWENSAMDGYAVRFADFAGAAGPATLRVVADVPAGSPLDPPLGPGEAARIMTGATLPSDADTVVQLEHTDRTDPTAPLADTVTVLRPPTAGMHVRRAGEDRGVGDPIAAAGTLITGTVATALAAAGIASVAAVRRPRVAVVATGSELIEPGDPIGRGQIPDSNSLLLTGLTREAGAEIVAVTRVGDDPDELLQVLTTTWDASQPDVVILTGGVSQGAYEPVKQALGRPRSGVEFVRVAMQPGKPQAFGRLGGEESAGPLIFGLPGNPVSVWVSFHVFVAPALRALAGAPVDAVNPAPTWAVVKAGWRTPGGRDQFLPAIITEAGPPQEPGRASTLTVSPAAAAGSKSHLVASLAAANGFAIIPAADQTAGRVPPGDVVAVRQLGPAVPKLKDTP